MTLSQTSIGLMTAGQKVMDTLLVHVCICRGSCMLALMHTCVRTSVGAGMDKPGNTY